MLDDAVKKVLKAADGKPMKVKKLIKLLAKEGVDESICKEGICNLKKAVKASVKGMKKAHLKDGEAWWGGKADPAEDKEQSPSKKRKAVTDGAEPEDAADKSAKKKKTKQADEEKPAKKTKKKDKKDEGTDEESEADEKKGAAAEVNTNGWNDWGKATFEDDARKNKFLRLMGGFKPGASQPPPAETSTKKKGLFGSLGSVTAAEAAAGKIEQEFDSALSRFGAGSKGLGYTAPKKNAWAGNRTRF